MKNINLTFNLDIKLPFTRSSGDDLGITLRTSRLKKVLSKKDAELFQYLCNDPSIQIIADVEGIPTKFLTSRDGTTLYSRDTNSAINTPEVGKGNEKLFTVGRIRVENLSNVKK